MNPKKITLLLASIFLLSNSAFLKAQNPQSHLIFKSDTNFGFIDTLGNVLVKPIYHSVEEFKDGFATVEIREGHRKYGARKQALIDEKGKRLIDFDSHSIKNLGNQMVLITKGYHKKMINLNSGKSISCTDCNLQTFSNLNWVILHKGHQRGVVHEMHVYDLDSNFLFQLKGKYLKRVYNIDQENNLTKPLNYLNVQIQRISQELHNIYNLKGELLLDSVAGSSDFYNGQMRLRRNGVYGYLDTNLNDIIGFDRGFTSIGYLRGGSFSDLVYNACIGDSCFFIYANGERVNNKSFSSDISWSDDGTVYNNRETGETFFFTQKKGLQKLDTSLIVKRYFKPKGANRNWVIAKNSKGFYGILDDNLQIRSPFVYDKIYQAENVLIYFKNDSSGFLDANGNIEQSLNQAWVSERVNGYGMLAMPVYGKTRADLPCAQFVFKSNESYAVQYVYLDSLGNRLNQETYDWAYPFDGEMAKVIKDCAIQYITKDGSPVQLGGYKVESDFNGEFVIVSNENEKLGLYKRGKGILIPCIFDEIKTMDGGMIRQHIYHKTEKTRNLATTKSVPKIENGFVWVKDGKAWGIYNLKGDEILQPDYSSIKITRDSCFFVAQNLDGLVGLLNFQGEIIVEFDHDYISIKSLTGYYTAYKGENSICITEKGRIIKAKLD